MEEHEERELRDKLERLKGQESGKPPHQEHRSAKKTLIDNRYAFLAIIIAILVINVVLRVGLLKYAGFFEPDGFFHYAVIRQAITLNHGIVPMNLTLSGFPAHNAITEPGGLYYVTIIPYAVLQYFGISYYTIMRYIPLVFGMLDAIGAYFIAKYLTNSRVAGLLAMLFISISSGDIARTAALVYRGDGFVTIFILVAFMLFVKTVMGSGRRSWIYAALAGITLAVAEAAWGGAPFGLVAFMAAIILLIVYAFIRADEKLLKPAVTLSLGLLLFYGIQRLFIAVKILRYVPALGSIHFFIFYLPILLGSLVALYLVRGRRRFDAIAGTWQRRAALAIALVALAVIALVVASPGYIGQLVNSAIGTGSLGTTIEELQRPSLAFIWQSFSWQIVLAPLGVVLFLLLGRRIVSKEHSMTANIAFIAVIAYFMVTLWLQLSAIRYNSLVAAPIAILAAYAVYAVPKSLMGNRRRWLIYIPIAIFAALMVLNTMQTFGSSFSSGQADGITPQFLQAMAWLRGNTPANATVLALWPDGSVVEGWGSRTSLMDSVGGQSGARIYNFSQWLFSTVPNATYLYNAGRPQYFVVRGYWIYEIGGIATEGGISNTSAYGYDTMSSLSIQRSQNATAYLFNSSAYPYYSAEMISSRSGNRTVGVQAYVGSVLSPNKFAIKNVIFINQSGGPYSKVASALNNTANYSLAVYFNGSSITGGAILGPKMPTSNFFKFVALCDYSGCPFGASNVTMQVVYQNSDAKIIKITYNT